jgi:hypothetical protein
MIESLEQRQLLSASAALADPWATALAAHQAIHMQPMAAVDMVGNWTGSFDLKNSSLGKFDFTLDVDITKGTSDTKASGSISASYPAKGITIGPVKFKKLPFGGNNGIFSELGFDGSFSQTMTARKWTASGTIDYAGYDFTFSMSLKR